LFSIAIASQELSSELESANKQISMLHKDSHALREEVQSLTRELTRSCEEQSLLRAEVGELQLEVAQGQGALKEAGLRMIQQVST
jgi:peptidoglycan hydrolase CwlO-like protein